MKAQHVFHHLGKAPYRLVTVQMREQAPDAPRVGTSCDYCGTYITNVFVCEGTDKKRFVLGSSCIEKLGDKGLVKQVKEAKKRKAQEERAERNRQWQIENEARLQEEEARRQKERAETIAKRRKSLNAVRTKLANTPHPNAYFASKGKTMQDYLEYFVGSLDELTDEHFIYNHKVLHAIEDAGGEI